MGGACSIVQDGGLPGDSTAKAVKVLSVYWTERIINVLLSHLDFTIWHRSAVPLKNLCPSGTIDAQTGRGRTGGLHSICCRIRRPSRVQQCHLKDLHWENEDPAYVRLRRHVLVSAIFLDAFLPAEHPDAQLAYLSSPGYLLRKCLVPLSRKYHSVPVWHH